MILCLPSENASGAHVFLSVFQRLPQKHLTFYDLSLFGQRSPQTWQIYKVMDAALGKHVQDSCLPVEDAGRRYGRPGHLPRFYLEEADPLIEIYYYFNLE